MNIIFKNWIKYENLSTKNNIEIFKNLTLRSYNEFKMGWNLTKLPNYIEIWLNNI